MPKEPAGPSWGELVLLFFAIGAVFVLTFSHFQAYLPSTAKVADNAGYIGIARAIRVGRFNAITPKLFWGTAYAIDAVSLRCPRVRKHSSSCAFATVWFGEHPAGVPDMGRVDRWLLPGIEHGVDPAGFSVRFGTTLRAADLCRYTPGAKREMALGGIVRFSQQSCARLGSSRLHLWAWYCCTGGNTKGWRVRFSLGWRSVLLTFSPYGSISAIRWLPTTATGAIGTQASRLAFHFVPLSRPCGARAGRRQT